MSAERWLTPTDRRLLRTLSDVPNLVRTARKIGIPRDRAVYRLQRLRRLYGAPVAQGRRGGARTGATRLTPLGRRLARGSGTRALRATAGGQRWSGTFRAGPPARLDIGRGGELEVAFRAREGERVTVAFDPEAVVIAKHRFVSSARNVLRAEVVGLARTAEGPVRLTARWSGRNIRVALTEASVARLGLAPGVAVYLYLKAVAIRRVARPSRGSPHR